jgi:hypothetical protein
MKTRVFRWGSYSCPHCGDTGREHAAGGASQRFCFACGKFFVRCFEEIPNEEDRNEERIEGDV